MTSIAIAAEIIRKWEGCALTAYLCPAGVWTVGWGATGPGIQRGTTWTHEQADNRLAADIAKFAKGVHRVVKVKLEPHQAGALYSFAYNIGLGAFEKSTLLRLLNAGDYKGAAAQFDRWNKAKGKVLNGLVRRRAHERSVFEGKP